MNPFDRLRVNPFDRLRINPFDCAQGSSSDSNLVRIVRLEA